MATRAATWPCISCSLSAKDDGPPLIGALGLEEASTARLIGDERSVGGDAEAPRERGRDVGRALREREADARVPSKAPPPPTPSASSFRGLHEPGDPDESPSRLRAGEPRADRALPGATPHFGRGEEKAPGRTGVPEPVAGSGLGSPGRRTLDLSAPRSPSWAACRLKKPERS